MRFTATLILALIGTCAVAQQPTLTKAEKQVLQSLEQRSGHYADVAHQIWDWAELGFAEDRSTELLQKQLREAGFQVETGVAGMPTAFVATYGSGKPVVAYLAEFDALPGMSQAAAPDREAIIPQAPGHACGHHLFGTGSVAAAIAVKDWLQATGSQGTIRLYGTPAEEGGGGKVFMVREGLFDDVDAVLTWHPSSANSAVAGSSLAIISAKFRFKGIAAHAAAGPWRGRSALDGVEAMNDMVNMMREHVTPDTRIHYAITNGSQAPNIVPAEAEVYYIVRHPEMPEVRSIFERVVKCAKGAAMGTETEVEYEVIAGYFNILPNETLARVMDQNLRTVGGVTYTPEERAFAEKIMTTYDAGKLTPDSSAAIQPFKVVERGGAASSDVGDISWVVPTASMGAATWVPGTVAHSWQAVAAGGMGIGPKGMMVAAKTMTLSAIYLFKNPETTLKAKEELLRRRGENFTYRSLVGDRTPPLDFMSQADPRQK